MSPKAFICHASEDKDRFVRDFAKKLRGKNVEAWFDEWEVVPGDSIVKKVFDEGIQEAKVFVIVLSNFSVTKRWVREELDIGVIKKINDGSKIIPVVIDDCEIPTALQATHWIKIEDINNYDAEFDRVMMSIYGHSNKPPLGAAPVYAETSFDFVPGLTPVDSLVLKLSLETAIEKGQAKHVDVSRLVERAKSLDIPEDEVIESLEILDRSGYHEQARLSGGGRRFHYFEITTFGFDAYARAYIPDYESLIMSIASQIINHGKKNNKEINQVLGQPQVIIDFILDVMHDRDWIRVSKATGGWSHVSEVFPSMKRALREN